MIVVNWNYMCNLNPKGFMLVKHNFCQDSKDLCSDRKINLWLRKYRLF